MCTTASSGKVVKITSTAQPSAASDLSKLLAVLGAKTTAYAATPKGEGFSIMSAVATDLWEFNTLSGLFPDQPAFTSCTQYSVGPNWGAFTQTSWYTQSGTTSYVGSTTTKKTTTATATAITSATTPKGTTTSPGNTATATPTSETADSTNSTDESITSTDENITSNTAAITTTTTSHTGSATSSTVPTSAAAVASTPATTSHYLAIGLISWILVTCLSSLAIYV